MPDEFDRDRVHVSGILGEMVELGQQRGVVPEEGRAMRPALGAQPCPNCGAEVTSMPLVSGRVFRCSGCGKSWNRPPASFVSTLDRADPRNQPTPDAPIEIDHLAVDARPFRINVVDKE